jgi:predicted metal-binding protein
LAERRTQTKTPPAALRREAARLAERARALGADHVAPLDAGRIVVDERVRLKCCVPLCSSYGQNLMCPPNVMSLEETRATLARYRLALVVQQDIPLTQTAVDEAFAGRGYAQAHDDDLPPVTSAQRAFATLMTRLETEAFKGGHRFAAAFAGGECVLCDECVGQDSGVSCRRPFEARPSAEAVGIDVVATAAAAGLVVELPADEHPRWTGLLLIG